METLKSLGLSEQKAKETLRNAVLTQTLEEIVAVVSTFIIGQKRFR